MEEAKREREGTIHHTFLDLMPMMWKEYSEIKKSYRILEKKYYGFFGIKYGRKKKEILDEQDAGRIEDLVNSLNAISLYCMSHKKPYLNERVYLLQFKLQDFIKGYRTSKNNS